MHVKCSGASEGVCPCLEVIYILTRSIVLRDISIKYGVVNVPALLTSLSTGRYASLTKLEVHKSVNIYIPQSLRYS